MGNARDEDSFFSCIAMGGGARCRRGKKVLAAREEQEVEKREEEFLLPGMHNIIFGLEKRDIPEVKALTAREEEFLIHAIHHIIHGTAYAATNLLHNLFWGHYGRQISAFGEE